MSHSALLGAIVAVSEKCYVAQVIAISHWNGWGVTGTTENSVCPVVVVVIKDPQCRMQMCVSPLYCC